MRETARAGKRFVERRDAISRLATWVLGHLPAVAVGMDSSRQAKTCADTETGRVRAGPQVCRAEAQAVSPEPAARCRPTEHGMCSEDSQRFPGTRRQADVILRAALDHGKKWREMGQLALVSVSSLHQTHNAS